MFLVGVCCSLKSSKVKLGDVVISEKLITCVPSSEQFGDKIPLKSLPLRLIPNAGDGWKAPLKDPKALKVKIHRGDILSVPGEIDNSECRETLIKRFPQAVAMELEGLGKHTVTQIYHSLQKSRYLKNQGGMFGLLFPQSNQRSGSIELQ